MTTAREKVSLFDICSPKQWPTLATSELKATGYPVYGANGVIGYYDKYTHKEPTILITCRGATCGKINISHPYSFVMGNAMALDNLDTQKILLGFLAYALEFNGLKSAITGSAQPQITLQSLRNVQIYISTIEEQKQIEKTLNKVSELIDFRKKQLSKLDQLVKARFVEIFGDPIRNEKEWPVFKAKDICNKITDGTHDTPERFDDGYLLITGKNIREFEFDMSNVEFVSEEDHIEIYKRCNPEYGDVLYTNIGVNYGTALFNNLTCEFSMKNVALLKPMPNLIHGRFLWCYLNIMRNHILEMNKCGGAQTFMGLATIGKIKIMLPPLALQREFADFVQKVDKTKTTVKQSLEKLETLKKSLMQEYFG